MMWQTAHFRPFPVRRGAVVCLPKQKPLTGKTSNWAERTFKFFPSPAQREVLDHAGKRLILCCTRQWGKTTVIALKSLHYAICHPGSTIVVLSRTKVQGGLLLDKVLHFSMLAGLPNRRVRGYSHSLLLPNGSRIYAIAHCGDTSPGRTADVLVVDEAAIVKDLVFGAVAPFVARSRGAIWLLSTPRGQTGFFYNYWHSHATQWDRIRSTADDCPDLDPEFLEMQRRIFPDTFRQEFYCEFTPAPGRLISRERLRAILDPNLKPL